MTSRLVEDLFFFGLLGVVAYTMWLIFAPFAGAFAFAAILATVSYPLFLRIVAISPKRNKSVASMLTILFVTIIVLVPLAFIVYLLVAEAITFYSSVKGPGATLEIEQALSGIQEFIQQIIPGFSIDVASYAGQAAEWLASNVGSIFAGTASTAFLLLIAFISLFYFFRDGKEFTKRLVHLSPLPDDEDEKILRSLAQAIRSVVLGRLSVALIQGILTAIGLVIFGVENAILLGSIATIGALIPTVGTSIIFAPIVLYMVYLGSYGTAIGLLIWGAVIVGLVDNILGPYLMSRGVDLHPFLIFIAVLGGLALFGPLGFVLGPVTLAFFMVLLDLYSTHLSPSHN